MSNQNTPHTEEDDEDPSWGLGWAYWAIWILATVLARNLSSLVRGAILEASGSSLSQVVHGVAIGIALGFAQWFVLLGQPYKTGIWQVGWQFFDTQGFGVVFGVIGLIAGGLVGFGQWWVFREQVQQAGWWIVANAVGWGVGLAVTYIYFRFSYGWLATSAITGAALIWLLRHPVPNDKTQGESL